MAEETPFSPLDSLGPEYGGINAPRLDAQGLSAFEGDILRDPKINFPKPENYFPVLPQVTNLDKPNSSIERNVVRTPANNPSISPKKVSGAQNKASITKSLDAFFQANQNKNNYAKIYSYNAGPDGNAFYKRYAAYGQETFDKIGFHPLRDNESNFNAQTSRWDDFSRMMTHSFVPLFSRGFVSGPKSLWKMAHGDFTSSDREDARAYEEAAAIGQSNKGGVFGFANNTMMNFGYTAGIISEAIVEEVAGALLAAPTGGASLFATTANIATKVPRALSLTQRAVKGYDAVKTTLRSFDSLNAARKFWNAASANKTVSAIGRGLNPLENSFEAFRAIKGTDNITDLAALSKTAGGFYRDVRKINMALSEARLEAGMVENKVYDKLYHEAYMAKGEPPSNKEQAELEKQAKDASLETLLANTALIYASNSITFNNITSPRGGLRNFIKSTTDDIYEIAAREGQKNFGKLGKVVYDKTARQFALQKSNLKNWAKGWMKNPIHKSIGSTIGYFKANFTEGIQENFQEVIAQANERYYIDSYKSPTLQTQLYSKGVIRANLKPKADYYAQGLKDQFNSQGLETFASGFFMGTLASPLNAAMPFLSSTYNRTFNKEEYAKWKKDQTAIAENLVKDLNSVKMTDFMSDRVMNTGSQDLISKIRTNASKKDGLDAETESFVNAVNTMRRTGTSGIFMDTLKSFKQYDDKEFADAMKITEDQVPKYRGRIDKAIGRLNNINNFFETAERKYPNPASLDNLGEEGTPEYAAKVALYKGWNDSIRNYAFFNEAYNDVKNRRAAIQNKYNTNANFQSLSSTDKSLLFQPERIIDEVKLLNTQLALEKDGENDSRKVNELESRIKLLSEFATAHIGFDEFFNRADEDKVKIIKEELKTKSGKEPTAEEIAEELDKRVGSLDDEELKMFHLLNLKNAHNNYLKTLSKDKGDYIFDDQADEAFEQLVDYYKLGQEGKALAKYVDIMNNPAEFMESARRNAETARKFYDRRVKYFEDLVASEMGKVRDNALLNTLADNQLYLNREDMENYLGDKNIPPSEIYDGKTKQIHQKGSEEYNKIYKEYFEKRAELKQQLNPKKTGVVKKSYQDQLAELEAKKQEEIDALPKISSKEYGEDIKRKGNKKSVNIKEINEQLQPGEYVEVDYKDAIAPMVFFMDAEGNLRYDNAEGEVVQIDEIKTKFTEAKKFEYTENPDPAEVKKIEDKYQTEIDKIMEAYNANMQDIEETIPFEEINQDTNLDTADLKDFRNMLYEEFITTYVDNLSQEEQDAIYADDNVTDAEFEKWYRLPQNKKYFDQYNKDNKPKPAPNNIVFSFEGTDLDTKDLSVQEIINYRDAINQKIANLDKIIEGADDFDEDATDSIKERLGLKTDVKNLNAIITRRQYESYPDEIKEAVLKIQKLIAAQKNVEEDYLLTEDDPVTGLKKGQKAYRINGQIHRRTTNAIQDVSGKEYEYQGQAQVDSAFNNTIGKNGLNENSINEFIATLNGLLETDNLPGANSLFIEKLTDQLRSLNGLTPEQIKLERQKDVLLKSYQKKMADIVKAEEDKLPERVKNLQGQMAEIDKQLIEIEKQLKGQKTTAPTTTPVADIEAKRTELEKKIEYFDNTIESEFEEGDYGKVLALAEKQIKDGTIPQTPQNVQLISNYPKLFEEFIKATDARNKTIEAFDKEKVLVGQPNELPIYTIESTINEATRRLEIKWVEGRKEAITNIQLTKLSNYAAPELINYKNKLQEELAALEQPTQQPTAATTDVEDEATKRNTTKDIIMTMFAEETYQDSRDAGNFLDDVKDYLESGVKPKFDETKITEEAYSNLFSPDGFITSIKKKVDSGEIFLVGRGLVVYDSDIVRADGTKDRIAGEIDLLIATKDGIFIVDIKSGEQNKWMNFNNNSKAKDKRNYSKREEYTLQQGAYAIMLERMIDYPVAGTALLPIQRSSNKETNQMTSAGKPTSMSVYYDMTFQKDKSGKYARNEFGELIGKTGTTRYSDWMVPLYKETVQDKLDILFPPKAVKFAPGQKQKANKRFNSFLVDLQSITDVDSAENVKALNKIEKDINDFAKVNNMEIPDNVKEALAEKKKALGQVVGSKLIETITAKYKDRAAKSKSDVDVLARTLAKIKIDVSFDNIDLDADSSFIQEQLAADKEFAERYNRHQQFIGKIYAPTLGQLVAADTLHSSGILTNAEFESIKENDMNSEEVSELIHEGVKRIQYLKATSDTSEELEKYKNYQSGIISLMTKNKVNQSNIGIANALELANTKVSEGDIKAALDVIQGEIFKLESQLKYATKEWLQKEIEKKLDDLNKVNEAIITTTGYTEEVFELPVEEETVGEEEEIDYEEQFDKIILKKGMTLFSKGAKFTVESFNTVKKEVTIKDDNDRTFTITMDELNKNYSTEEDILGPEVTEPVILTPEEEGFVKESQDNLSIILDDAVTTDALMQEADGLDLDKAEDDLLDDLNCK